MKAQSCTDIHIILLDYYYSDLIESRLLSFVTAEEDLRMEASCPLNEATAVFMLKNLCYHRYSQ